MQQGQWQRMGDTVTDDESSSDEDNDGDDRSEKESGCTSNAERGRRDIKGQD